MLAASGFRYQIEAIVTPFKSTLVGLFFIAVGMSIDVADLIRDFQQDDYALIRNAYAEVVPREPKP